MAAVQVGQAQAAAPLEWRAVDLGPSAPSTPPIANTGEIGMARSIWMSIAEPVVVFGTHPEPLSAPYSFKWPSEISSNGAFVIGMSDQDAFLWHREYVFGHGWMVSETVLGKFGYALCNSRGDVNARGLAVFSKHDTVWVHDAQTGLDTTFTSPAGWRFYDTGRTPINDRNEWVADASDSVQLGPLHCTAVQLPDGTWDCVQGLKPLPLPVGHSVESHDINDLGTVVGAAEPDEMGPPHQLWACAVQPSEDGHTCLGGSVMLGGIDRVGDGTLAINNHNFIVASSPPGPNLFCDLDVSIFGTQCAGGLQSFEDRVTGIEELELLEVHGVNDDYVLSATAFDRASATRRTLRLEPVWF
jgi:hypothetical protein